MQCTNGMSNSHRNAKFANAGLVVAVSLGAGPAAVSKLLVPPSFGAGVYCATAPIVNATFRQSIAAIVEPGFRRRHLCAGCKLILFPAGVAVVIESVERRLPHIIQHEADNRRMSPSHSLR